MERKRKRPSPFPLSPARPCGLPWPAHRARGPPPPLPPLACSASVAQPARPSPGRPTPRARLSRPSRPRWRLPSRKPTAPPPPWPAREAHPSPAAASCSPAWPSTPRAPHSPPAPTSPWPSSRVSSSVAQRARPRSPQPHVAHARVWERRRRQKTTHHAVFCAHVHHFLSLSLARKPYLPLSPTSVSRSLSTSARLGDAASQPAPRLAAQWLAATLPGLVALGLTVPAAIVQQQPAGKPEPPLRCLLTRASSSYPP
jgi:hypothetical protein